VTADAIPFAWWLHDGQRRASDEAPFILHPLEVAALLYDHGATDEVIAAGVLHDVVEDTSASSERIRRRFGSAVAGLVASVSEDPRIEEERERKAALRDQVEAAAGDAALIFAADKVAKVRELRTFLVSAGCADLLVLEAADRKLEHYMASLAMLERALPGHPLVVLLRFELEAMRELPPAAEGSSRGRDRSDPPATPMQSARRSRRRWRAAAGRRYALAQESADPVSRFERSSAT
jgi:hypothetical protein